jgi:hypothetical protein
MPFLDLHAENSALIVTKWRQVEIKQVQAILAVATASWDPVTTRMEHLNNPDIGPMLQEMQSGRHLGWKNIAGQNPTYRYYWAQWKLLAVKNCILERH